MRLQRRAPLCPPHAAVHHSNLDSNGPAMRRYAGSAALPQVSVGALRPPPARSTRWLRPGLAITVLFPQLPTSPGSGGSSYAGAMSRFDLRPDAAVLGPAVRSERKRLEQPCASRRGPGPAARLLASRVFLSLARLRIASFAGPAARLPSASPISEWNVMLLPSPHPSSPSGCVVHESQGPDARSVHLTCIGSKLAPVIVCPPHSNVCNPRSIPPPLPSLSSPGCSPDKSGSFRRPIHLHGQRRFSCGFNHFHPIPSVPASSPDRADGARPLPEWPACEEKTQQANAQLAACNAQRRTTAGGRGIRLGRLRPPPRPWASWPR